MTPYSNIPENPDPTPPETYTRSRETRDGGLALFTVGGGVVWCDVWLDVGEMQ